MVRIKEDIVRDIARELGVHPPHVSTGSTEPREIFDLVNSTLGLGLSPQLTKPEIAAAIVASAGGIWTPKCESRGGTVTKSGLELVLAAVLFFTQGAPMPSGARR